MNQSITNISVEVLKVHPRNTEFFDDISGQEYERFKKSIEEDGLLSPLIVAPDMTIISGHQRLKACKELNFKTVPIIINDNLDDEDEKLKKLIAANFGRLKNDPIKQAKLLKEYEKLSGVQHGGDRKSKRDNLALISQDQIAKELGMTTRQLQDIKRLTTLLPDLQDIISSGEITATTGYKVLAKLTEEEQRKLLDQLPVSRKLTQNQVEEYVSRIKELENINDGYKIKLKSQENKTPPDTEKLINEKTRLETEKRQWYEKAQTYKKEAETFEKKLEQVQSQKPTEKIAEVISKDSQKMKDEIVRLEEELKRANFVMKNKVERDDIAKRFGATELITIINNFAGTIGSFQFAGEEIKKATKTEIKQLEVCLTQAQEDIEVIRKNIKGA